MVTSSRIPLLSGPPNPSLVLPRAHHERSGSPLQFSEPAFVAARTPFRYPSCFAPMRGPSESRSMTFHDGGDRASTLAAEHRVMRPGRPLDLQPSLDEGPPAERVVAGAPRNGLGAAHEDQIAAVRARAVHLDRLHARRDACEPSPCLVVAQLGRD